MWFILMFLCAFGTAANPLNERRNLGLINVQADEMPEMDVDSVLSSPEDLESLVDLDDSGVSTFEDDSPVGDDKPNDEFDDSDFDADKAANDIIGEESLMDEVEKEVKESVGQPPEVIAKYGHSKYDGPDRPGKLHDGERPQENESNEAVEEKGRPKALDSEDEAEDNEDLPKSHTIFVHPPIVIPAHKGPSPKEVIPAPVWDDKGEPGLKQILRSEDSDDSAADMVRSQKSHSKLMSPKVAEIVSKGTVQDSNSKQYKILKPLKIPYSELPEHIRPPNWMEGYKLVPVEKPTEKPDYNKLNFETPVTTHPATPNRVIDIDARNPAFYTRPPTASPPPRPVVHMNGFTYKIEPSDELKDLLLHPPALPTLPEIATTQKPKGIFSKKFLKYLDAMGETRRAEFKAALADSDARSKALFANLVKKIIAVSEQGMRNSQSRDSQMQDTVEKLEDNMEQRFEEFKSEQEAKYAGKLSKARSKLKNMADNQVSLEKQFRDAIVDVKQEVSDDIARARKAHEQESIAGRREQKKLRAELEKLRKQTKKTKQDVDDEGSLLRKLNKLRKKAGKKPLSESVNSPAMSIDVTNSNGDSSMMHYRCSSCQTAQCRSACSRCNNCKTDRCRNVCKCGRTYRKHLNRLKNEVRNLKQTWGRKNRHQQRKLIAVLRDKLRQFRLKFHAALKGDGKKKKSKKFRTLLFGSWAKRSHRRLYRLLEDDNIHGKVKREIVRVFHRYYHRAMRESAEWEDSDQHLEKYLSTVTRIWTKTVEDLIRAEKKLQKKKKRAQTTKAPAAVPVKPLPKAEKLPPRPPPIPKRSDAEKPYAERLYTHWRSHARKFIDVYYDSIPAKSRGQVMGYVKRIFALVRKKYVDYLSRDYASGTRYSRRKRFLDWLMKVSDYVNQYVHKAILGKNFSTDHKSGYLNRIWAKWAKKSRVFVRRQIQQIRCKEKAKDYINDIFKDAKQAKRNHEAMKSTKATKMKFLNYLVKTSKQLRAKTAFFKKTCKPVKGPRPYVTKMYKRWKRLSGKFVEKNTDPKRMCKERYRKEIKEHWENQKKEAEKKYREFLSKEVKKMDTAKSESSEASIGDDEVKVGKEDNEFILHLKKEARSLESFVRKYLRKCGWTIVPRESEQEKTKLKKIRAKYKKKMEKLNESPPESMIAKDNTYGITLGFGNQGNANNIGIGIENMKKDRNGAYQYTPWKFNDDADFKRSSYDVGVSFDRD